MLESDHTHVWVCEIDFSLGKKWYVVGNADMVECKTFWQCEFSVTFEPYMVLFLVIVLLSSSFSLLKWVTYGFTSSENLKVQSSAFKGSIIKIYNGNF